MYNAHKIQHKLLTKDQKVYSIGFFCSFTLCGFTPTSLFDKNDSLTKISFSALWLVETDLQNRDFRVPTEAESGFEFLKQNRDNPA